MFTKTKLFLSLVAAAVLLFFVGSSSAEIITMNNFSDWCDMSQGSQTLAMVVGVNLVINIDGVDMGVVEAGYYSGNWHLGLFDSEGYIIGYAQNVQKAGVGREGRLIGAYSSLLGVGNTPTNVCLIYDSTGNGWGYDTETTLLGTDQDFLDGDLFFWTTDIKFDGVLGGVNLMDPYTATAETARIPELAVTIAAPEPVVLVSPSDNAVDVGIDAVLEWRGEDGGIYNLYMGYDAGSLEPVLAGGMDESVTVYGLDWNSVYYWQVEMLKDGETYTSAIWSFITVDYACQEELLGDLNYDCEVNLSDLAIIASNWLAETPKIPLTINN